MKMSRRAEFVDAHGIMLVQEDATGSNKTYAAVVLIRTGENNKMRNWIVQILDSNGDVRYQIECFGNEQKALNLAFQLEQKWFKRNQIRE